MESVPEVWTYNLWTEQWRKHRVRKVEEIPNKFLVGVAIGSDMYMYEALLGTVVWKVTRSTGGSFEWSTINFEKSKMPSPRAATCVWEYEEKLWIFGGVGWSPSGYLNNHGDFAQSTEILGGPFGHNNQLLSFDPAVQSWENVKYYGEVPTPRSHASAAAIKNKVWLFGGINTSLKFNGSNEFYELNMHTVTWTWIKTNMPWPPRMGASSLTPITGTQLVLREESDQKFGWILDVQSYTWSQYKISNGYKHTKHRGITGLSSDVILIGGNDIYGTDTDCHLFSVMLKPKSLAQLAMKQIYKNREELPWNNLPPQLICKLMGTE